MLALEQNGLKEKCISRFETQQKFNDEEHVSPTRKQVLTARKKLYSLLSFFPFNILNKIPSLDACVH